MSIFLCALTTAESLAFQAASLTLTPNSGIYIVVLSAPKQGVNIVMFCYVHSVSQELTRFLVHTETAVVILLLLFQKLGLHQYYTACHVCPSHFLQGGLQHVRCKYII